MAGYPARRTSQSEEETADPLNKRNGPCAWGHGVRKAATKNMNRYTHQENTNYGKPFNLSFRRKPRRFKRVNYSRHSPELLAMTAHLRASAYRDRRQRPAAGVDYDIERAEAPSIRTLSFSSLLRDYDSQARNNFTKEALLFAIIVVIGMMWPIVQTFRGLPR